MVIFEQLPDSEIRGNIPHSIRCFGQKVVELFIHFLLFSELELVERSCYK